MLLEYAKEWKAETVDSVKRDAREFVKKIQKQAKAALSSEDKQ